MRSISLKAYTVQSLQPDPKNPTVAVKTDVDFDVKGSMVTVLYGRGVEGRELLKRHSIAQKIEKGTFTVLLEEEEYQTLLAAFRAWPAFGRNEVELIQRVEEAEKVAVKADNKPRANRKRSDG